MGNPSELKPAGSVMAGLPLRLNGCVYGYQDCRTVPVFLLLMTTSEKKS